MNARLLMTSLAIMISVGWVYLNIAGRVGSTLITHEDVRRYQKVHEILHPEEPQQLGYSKLVQAYTNYHILRNNGFKFTPEVLDEMKDQIESNLDPAKLKNIKDVFANDLQAYKKVFLVPTLVDHVLIDFFTSKIQIHQSDSTDSNQSFLEWKNKEALKVTIYPTPED